MGTCTSNQVDQKNQIDFENVQFSSLDYNRGSTYVKLDQLADQITKDQLISEQYNSLLTRIIASKQEHIVKILKTIPENQKNQFISNFENVDYEMMDAPLEAKILNLKLEIYSSEEIEVFRQIGLELIRDGKVAIVILAGGLSERFGGTVNKLIADIQLESKKTLLQLIFEKIKRIIVLSSSQNDLNIDQDNVNIAMNNLKIFISINEQNGYQIKQYLNNNQYFGFIKQNIEFCYQRSIPIIDSQGRITLKDAMSPNLCANGTGNVIQALNNINYIEKIKGIEYIQFLGAENLLSLPFDPIALGLIKYNNTEILCKHVQQQQNLQLGLNPILRKEDKSYYLLDKSQINSNNIEGKIAEIQSSETELINDIIVEAQFLQRLKKLYDKGLQFQQRFHEIGRVTCVYDYLKNQFNQKETIRFEKLIHDLIEVSSVVAFLQVNPDEQYLPIIWGPDDEQSYYKTKLSQIHQNWLNLSHETESISNHHQFGEGMDILFSKDKSFIEPPLL